MRFSFIRSNLLSEPRASLADVKNGRTPFGSPIGVGIPSSDVQRAQEEAIRNGRCRRTVCVLVDVVLIVVVLGRLLRDRAVVERRRTPANIMKDAGLALRYDVS
jgi:hypothetical protein